MIRRVVASCLVLAGFPVAGVAASPLSGGSILVQSGGTVYAYSSLDTPPTGQITVPYPGTSLEPLRDFVTDGSGTLFAFNGTTDPYLSIYLGFWAHFDFAGWNVAETGGEGGIALNGGHVYVTDLGSGPDDPGGILRISLVDFQAERYGVGVGYVDLTLGLDGYLYGLEAGGLQVDVFDPWTMEEVRSMTLSGSQIQGIAVDLSGNLYGAEMSGTIIRCDATGALQRTASSEQLATTSEHFVDIDISPWGDVLIGTDSGKVILTDGDLDPAHTTIVQSPSTGATFVAFGPAGMTPVRNTTWGVLKHRF